MLRYICGLTAVVLSVGAAPAEENLAWKFKEGDIFYAETVSKVKQVIKAGGMDIKQNITLTFLSHYTVKKTGDVTVLEQKIQDAKVASTGELGGADKVMEKTKGAVFTVTLAADGSLTKFSGYDDLVKRIAKEGEKEAQMFKLTLPEDMLKEEAAQTFGFLPGKAVSKGDTWKRAWTMSMGPLGSFKAENAYTYTGKNKDGVAIAFTTTGTYSPPQGDAGDAPFKVTKGKLETKAAKGTIVFDAARGRLLTYKIGMVVKGSLTLEALGNKIDAELEQEGSSTIRVSDKAPSDD